MMRVLSRTTLALLLALAVVVLLASGAIAQVASSDEALTVAQNWVKLIIDKRGDWGGSQSAQVTGIQDYKRAPDSPVLAYFCPVSPKGWIVVSRYKDLASVKAYSDETDMDPTDNEGMGDYVKGGLEGMVRSVEKQLKKSISQATSEEIQSTLNVSFRASWRLLGGDRPVTKDGVEESGDVTRSLLQANYAGGQVLTTTTWHQGDPYNLTCPAGDGCDHCIVGCVATAGAQVMRYWCWPPTGVGSPYDDTYDWKNMPNSATSGSSTAVKNAVAELSAEVGQAVGMSYGCNASSATTSNMEGVYENQYRYADVSWLKRHNGWPWPFDAYNYTADEWFNIIKDQMNVNRPIQYRIDNHSIVCDGWQEVGSPTVKQYHMNYGWGGSASAWYTLDALHQVTDDGSIKDEMMATNIRPNCALGSTLSGTYTLPSYPYRYFDMDTICSGTARFNSGHNLQFLPKVVVTSTSTTDGLYIDGTTSLTTRLFTRGDTSKGAKIEYGTIKVLNGGSLVLK